MTLNGLMTDLGLYLLYKVDGLDRDETPLHSLVIA